MLAQLSAARKKTAHKSVLYSLCAVIEMLILRLRLRNQIRKPVHSEVLHL